MPTYTDLSIIQVNQVKTGSAEIIRYIVHSFNLAKTCSGIDLLSITREKKDEKNHPPVC